MLPPERRLHPPVEQHVHPLGQQRVDPGGMGGKEVGKPDVEHTLEDECRFEARDAGGLLQAREVRGPLVPEQAGDLALGEAGAEPV